jgi:hypothetical protein
MTTHRRCSYNCYADTPVRNTKPLDTAIDGEGVGDMTIVEPVARGTHLYRPLMKPPLINQWAWEVEEPPAVFMSFMKRYQYCPVVGVSALLFSGRLHAP